MYNMPGCNNFFMPNFMNPFGMQPNFMDLMSNPMYSIPTPMFNPFSMPMGGMPMGGMPMGGMPMGGMPMGGMPMGMGNPYAMPMGTPQMPYGGNIWDMQMQQQYQMPYGYNVPQYGYRPGYTGNGGYNPVFDINRDGKLDNAEKALMDKHTEKNRWRMFDFNRNGILDAEEKEALDLYNAEKGKATGNDTGKNPSPISLPDSYATSTKFQSQIRTQLAKKDVSNGQNIIEADRRTMLSMEVFKGDVDARKYETLRIDKDDAYFAALFSDSKFAYDFAKLLAESDKNKNADTATYGYVCLRLDDIREKAGLPRVLPRMSDIDLTNASEKALDEVGKAYIHRLQGTIKPIELPKAN